MIAETLSQKVLVDMDGVLFDFDGEVRRRLEVRYPDIQPLQLDPPDFYTANNYAKDYQDRVWAISNEQGFVANLPLVDGALLGWERLLAAGYIPQICSTLLPERYAPHCKQEKLAALEDHFVPNFGAWVVETALFTPDKHLARGMALIDDRPAPIKHSEEATWEHVIFDRACNRTPESKDYVRLHGWSDPELPEKLEEANRRHLAKTR